MKQLINKHADVRSPAREQGFSRAVDANDDSRPCHYSLEPELSLRAALDSPCHQSRGHRGLLQTSLAISASGFWWKMQGW